MTTRRTLCAAAAAGTVLALSAGCSDDPAAPAAPAATAAVAPSTQAPAAPPAAEQRTALSEAVALPSLVGRSTTLTVDQRALAALGAAGIRLRPVAPAQVQTSSAGTRISFPVTGGSVSADPTATRRVTGEVQHAGGLTLSALGRTVTVDRLLLDADEEVLTAEVAGRRLPLLPVDLDDARLEREGAALVLTDDAVSLDPSATRRLADQLGLPGLPGLQLGRLEVVLTGP